MSQPVEDEPKIKPFEELVERLTRRFERDPELQFEIRQELRTHLEDCAAEFAATGMKPDAAQAEAKKALGNEEEIAEQLWQANRRRLKVRKAAKWAAGLTVIPAAGASAIAIGWGALSCLAIVASSLFLFGATQGYEAPASSFDLTHKVALSIAQVRLNHALSGLTPQQRTLFDGPKMGILERLDWSRNIAESHGNDPVYWANYAIQAGDDSMRYPSTSDSPGITAAQALEIIDRAQQTEPDNALYPMMKASALIFTSFKFVDPPDYNPKALTPYEFAVAVPGKKEPEVFALDPFEITDPTVLAQGLQQLHIAAGKPYFQSHMLDLSQRRLELLPRPSTFADWAISRGFESYQTFWPHLNSMRLMTVVAGWAAYQAALAGDGQKARSIIADARRFSILAAQHSPTAIELLVADGMYEQALVAEAVVERQLKEPQKSQAAIQAALATQQFWISLQSNGSWRDRGGTDDIFAIFKSNLSPDAPPSYAGDYELADRLSLSVLEMVMVAAALFAGVGSVGLQWFDRRRAALLFIGWKRVLAIALIATLAPVAVYGVYANLTPLGGRQVDVTWSAERLILEYALVTATMLILLRVFTNRAVQKRAREIGDDAMRPRPVGWIRISLGSLLAIGSVTYFFLWHHAIAQPTQDAMNGIESLGGSLGILVLVYGLSWL
ncbi:MAG: permease prefix domain 1-containing protein, partial [Tepidisphaeraceae bacterium]